MTTEYMQPIKRKNGPSRFAFEHVINCALKSEVAMILPSQLCYNCYTVLQMKNRNFFAMNPVTTENAGKSIQSWRGKLYCNITTLSVKRTRTQRRKRYVSHSTCILHGEQGMFWDEATQNSEKAYPTYARLNASVSQSKENSVKQKTINLLEGFGVTLETFLGLAMLNHDCECFFSFSPTFQTHLIQHLKNRLQDLVLQRPSVLVLESIN